MMGHATDFDSAPPLATAAIVSNQVALLLPRIGWCAVLMAVLASACRPSPEASRTSPEDAAPRVTPPTLSIVTVGQWDGGGAVTRAWRAQTDGELAIETVSPADFLADVEGSVEIADVVIYPAALLGEMAPRDLLAELAEAGTGDAAALARDVLALDRRVTSRWGDQPLAVSLGQPQWVLWYRRDIFDALGLKTPTSWTEYADVVDQIRRAMTDGHAAVAGLTTATCEPTAEGWAGETLLVRAAPYVASRGRYSGLFDVDSLQPLIDTPPFEHALEEMLAAVDKTQPPLTAAQAVEEIALGRTAMALGPTDCAPRGLADDAAEGSALAHLGVTSVPGAAQRYDYSSARWVEQPADARGTVPLVSGQGWLASVLAQSPNESTARGFLEWLTSKETSASVLAGTGQGGPTRTSQLAAPDRWWPGELPVAALEGLADATRAANESELWVGSLRIPGRADYMAALDRAVVAAFAGEASPHDALATAAEKWRELTAKLGADEQRRAYRASVGLEE